ncbi:MAG TPA: hypothetical protein VGQ31_05835 [Candidatus Limnocylindrales bacterium]|jgi:hypothetical protein|nr:hypothetical protein [Candidatus Limnocylindrales bacterium]
MSLPRRLVPGLVTLLVVLVVTGCNYVETVPPSPSPADFQGVATELAKRGIIVDRVVSGDPGCPDKALAPTARSFDASGLDQATTVRVYLFMFADRATYERLRTSVDECARSFVTDPQTYQSVEQSPFVLAGQGPWGTAFESALRAGLLVAAGSGDNAGSDYP